MKRTICCYVIVSLLLVIVAVGGIWATESPRDFIQAYRIWKLTDALELSEEQMPEFFTKLRAIDRRESELRKQEHEAIRDIAGLLDREDVDDAELEKAFGRYDEIRTQHWEEMGRLRQEAVGMLSVKQRCQYVVFEQRFRSHMKDIITRVRGMDRRKWIEEGGEFGPPGGFEGRDDADGFGPGRSRPEGSGRGRR